jgi:hypothetical protein
MSTRKLILTALLCGIAIMIAGGVKLFQVSSDESEVQVLALGTDAKLGDMTVSVTDIIDSTDALLVSVTMVGVDGDVAQEGWRLLADGQVTEPIELPKGVGVPCGTVSSTAPMSCTIAFVRVDSSPVVAYLRAGEQFQWSA